MQTLRVLIVGSDRPAARRIEGLVLDVCFERAEVECHCSANLADIEKLTRVGWPNLVILSPDNLVLLSGLRGFRQVMAESLQLIGTIRKHTLLPFIAFGVSQDDAAVVLEAGVEAVFGPFWDGDVFKNELERVLRLPARIEQVVPPSRWQMFSNLLKGLSVAR
jgi:hypothetical protein